MPSYPTLSRSRPGPRRRSLLAGTAGAVLLTGCSDAGSGDGRSADAERLRARAARDSSALLRRYDAVIAAHAPLSARLRPLREEVARHAKAFADGGLKPAPAASERAAGPPVPGDRKDALRLLATAERELARRRGKQLLDAPGELARLLASVAAAGAAHAYLLTEKGAEGNGEGDDK
ncbi:hypothetical protein [Streptomyces sp. MNP-20]|uniref:hypothetical protein n=1 Tax=Streptomyces sp. MNP-20 TaxID=2721165 RepID=UPI0015574930|nr:hypothetical protein [Streptomyces sp. MNP-20]